MLRPYKDGIKLIGEQKVVCVLAFSRKETAVLDAQDMIANPLACDFSRVDLIINVFLEATSKPAASSIEPSALIEAAQSARHHLLKPDFRSRPYRLKSATAVACRLRADLSR